MQHKSIEERKRFALLVSVVITGIIFAIWLSARISLGGVSTQSNHTEQFETTPFDSFKAAAGSIYEDVKGLADIFNKTRENLQKQGQNGSDTGL